MDCFNNVSDNASIHVFLANNYISDGKLELATEEADKAIMLNPKSYNKSWIYYLQGDFVQMEKECEEMLESDKRRGANQCLYLQAETMICFLFLEDWFIFS